MDPPRLDDFVAVKVVGKGSYGKVMLVRKDKEVFAMKMLRKEHLVKRNQVEHTKTERNVLEAVSHPFIVTMHYAFQTPKKLFFVLEFCPGGELFFHLSRAGRFSEGRCRFYASEILEAINYLHRLNIIYRDLKPENILLDGEGHVKLTDFGLSKEGIDDNFSAKSMCGTPEYLAPEILDKRGHGKAVDWYSHGALVFEMLTGLPPHYTRDREQLFERIRSATLTYPAYVSPVAKDMLGQLLARDPKDRLGAGPGDGDEVKVHAWFAGIDWSALLAKKVTPPFKPNIRADGEVKYVEEEFLKMGLGTSEGPASTAEESHFEGFTYIGH